METALSATGLVKRYDGRPVVDGLNLTVPRRAIYGFLGRNGAGKTTTMRMVLGLVRPDAGRLTLFGDDRRQRSAVVGALIEAPTVWGNLTGRENLEVTRRLLGADRGEVDRVLAVAGIADVADRRAGGYSLGMRQRLGIARALIGGPRLLVLDEPTNGLDTDGIEDVRHLLARLVAEDDVTVIVSSHLLDEVERVATHVGLVAHGRMVAEGPIAQVRGSVDPVVEVESDAGAGDTLAAAGFGFTADGCRLLVRTDAADRLAALLIAAGHPVSHLVRRERRLEHLFDRTAFDRTAFDRTSFDRTVQGAMA